MTENKNVILSARDIVVEFDVRDRVLTAIRGVSLDLVEGEVLALVGESGSGKSVLTKTFTGMLEENGRVASGSIDYRGQDLTKLKSHQDWAPIRGAKIATIFQDPMTSLDPIKTIGSQIVEVIVKHQGKSAKEAKKMAIDYMDKVGIPDAEKRFNEYPFQYSGGILVSNDFSALFFLRITSSICLIVFSMVETPIADFIELFICSKELSSAS